MVRPLQCGNGNSCIRKQLKKKLTMKTFENKVALVTGAAMGIGLAAAKAFAEAGATAVLADYDEKAVKAAAEGLAGEGYKTLAIVCDVSDDKQVEAMVQQTVSTFGSLD